MRTIAEIVSAIRTAFAKGQITTSTQSAMIADLSEAVEHLQDVPADAQSTAQVAAAVAAALAAARAHFMLYYSLGSIITSTTGVLNGFINATLPRACKMRTLRVTMWTATSASNSTITIQVLKNGVALPGSIVYAPLELGNKSLTLDTDMAITDTFDIQITVVRDAVPAGTSLPRYVFDFEGALS